MSDPFQSGPHHQPYEPQLPMPYQHTGTSLEAYSYNDPAPYGQGYAPAPVAGFHLVSVGGRFGACLLDGLLFIVTLGIGWWVWTLITWSDGQTPAKKLLGHVVVEEHTGRPFDWGRMALREFVIKGLLGWVLNTVTFSIYFWIDSCMVFGDRQRTLHDRMSASVVRHI